MAERIGAQEKQAHYRRRREAAINRLVAEVKVGEDRALEEDGESEASPYREAEELARRLHRGR